MDQPSSQSGAVQIFLALVNGTTAIPRAAAKLLDTVGEQIGLALKPVHTRRQARAEAAIEIIKAESEQKLQLIKAETPGKVRELKEIQKEEQVERAVARVEMRESRRQTNLEAITAQASCELPKEEAVNDTPVDQDWVAQFLNNAQDVSNEQMQSVWARILAGEVAKPGTFSLATLAAVKIMSKLDADLFTRFGASVWRIDQHLAPLLFDQDDMMLPSDLKFTLEEFLRLETLGMIRYESLAGYNLQFSPTPSVGTTLLCTYFGHSIQISHSTSNQMETGIAVLTVAGKELFAIAGAVPNPSFRDWVVVRLQSRGWSTLRR